MDCLKKAELLNPMDTRDPRSVRDRPVPCSVAHATGKAPHGNRPPVTHGFAEVGMKSAGVLFLEDTQQDHGHVEKGARHELV